jgi:S-adenosylmethionine decarboxylase
METTIKKDYFVVGETEAYAGYHYLIDLFGAQRLTDVAHIRGAVLQAVEAAGATLLSEHFHVFESSGGVSGVAVLAESHISVHTWPERDYAAYDVFMCGDTQPERVASILEAAHCPERTKITPIKRGLVIDGPPE